MKKFLVLFDDGYFHQNNVVEAETPDQAIEIEVETQCKKLCDERIRSQELAQLKKLQEKYGKELANG